MNMNNNKGFTLLETLVCLIFVTAITGMVVLISNVATEAYFTMEKNSEGQVLCGILTNSIQDELKYTVDISKLAQSHNIYDSETSQDTGYDGYEFKFVSASRVVTDPANKDNSIQVDGCSFDDSSGKIYLKSNQGSFPLTGNSSYVFNITAKIKTYYMPTKKAFYIDLKIYDDDLVIISAPFVVDTLNPEKLPND